MWSDLRKVIGMTDLPLDQKLKIGKQIASGMNFLHSLRPHILVRVKDGRS